MFISFFKTLHKSSHSGSILIFLRFLELRRRSRTALYNQVFSPSFSSSSFVCQGRPREAEGGRRAKFLFSLLLEIEHSNKNIIFSISIKEIREKKEEKIGRGCVPGGRYNICIFFIMRSNRSKSELIWNCSPKLSIFLNVCGYPYTVNFCRVYFFLMVLTVTPWVCYSNFFSLAEL